MKRSPLTRWMPVGFLGIAILAVVSLPTLSATASLGDGSLWAGLISTSEQGDEEETQSVSPSASGPTTSSQVEADGDNEDGPTAAEIDKYCALGQQAIEEARQLIHYREYESAHRLLLALLSDESCLDDVEHRDLARFQHAYLLHLLDRPEEVLQRLDELETEPPIIDYVHWLRGLSLSAQGEHSRAADVFGAIYEIETSPLHWKARARQSKSLVDAERYEEALPIVATIVELFPDYPRRHRALYDHGRTLEALDRLEEAAEAYQQAYFEFPYKTEGQLAKKRQEALASQGVEATPIDPQRRYEQYRQLSVDKFWPLAHELLTELRREIRTPDGNSRLENQILQRIALNAYHSHDYERAAEYFQQARDIIEDGHERGFSRRTIYRYHSFALGRLGRYEEAKQALETLHARSSRRARLDEFGSFYERYGRYEEAYDIYDQLYTARQKRGWHFSYLKYKTGRFEEAYENLRRLARYSRGETRAQYLYWAARSLERAGNNDEAVALYAEIYQTRPTSYYGLQAANRLVDLRQRSTVDGSFLAQADRLGDAAEQVLDAFDAATTPMGSGSVDSDHDPRTRPISITTADDMAPRDSRSEWIASLSNGNCQQDEDCSPAVLGLPFPTYGLTWDLGQPLLDPLMSDIFSSMERSRLEDPSSQNVEGLDYEGAPEVRVPRRHVEFPGEDVPRVRFHTDARIYWNGRNNSDIAFVGYSRGKMIGPVPSQWTAYDDDTHVGGLQRALEEAGHLFPRLDRVHWLYTAGWYTEARRVIRDVSLEYRGLTSRSRPRSSPHELPHKRWAYYIDNRRRSQRADYWGMKSDELRFPIPDDAAEREKLLQRQQEIHERRRELRPLIVEALQEVGDYHLVRRFALGDTWWLREAPVGEARRYWAMAYPRGFPEQVIPLAKKHNVNPYMIWALMLVESSFNPDSISIADALGLLQVIPRTGLKIADLFGADDFGPFDLLEADNSIEHGVFYFSRLVQKFHGQELLAFAGYNGGPHRVGGWLDMRGHNIPLDEFVEEIPFTESRGYAKKVLRFLHIYLRIYEDYDTGLYVGQNLDPNYLPQPDF